MTLQNYFFAMFAGTVFILLTTALMLSQLELIGSILTEMWVRLEYIWKVSGA
jgi:hypothetical protein